MKKALVSVVVASLVLTQFTGAVYAKEQNTKKSSKYSKQDKDSNGIPDWWQSKYHLGFGKNLASKDNDKDGLNNLVEYQLDLNPISKYSDKDKITDGNEDKDNDSLTNLQELKSQLNPLSADSDKDGLKDSYEDNDTDGLNTKEEFIIMTNPVSSDSDKDGVNDGNEDKDVDGLNNESEFLLGYNPLSGDSDKDGIKDGNEDLDKDGIANKQEVRKMEIKIVNSEGKKLSIKYESAKYKHKIKYKIKDEIGVGDVKSLLDNFILTPDMTKDEITNQIKQAFGINDIIKYELEVKFQNSKKLKSEFENKDSEQKQDDDDDDDNDNDNDHDDDIDNDNDIDNDIDNDND